MEQQCVLQSIQGAVNAPRQPVAAAAASCILTRNALLSLAKQRSQLALIAAAAQQQQATGPIAHVQSTTAAVGGQQASTFEEIAEQLIVAAASATCGQPLLQLCAGGQNAVQHAKLAAAVPAVPNYAAAYHNPGYPTTDTRLTVPGLPIAAALKSEFEVQQQVAQQCLQGQQQLQQASGQRQQHTATLTFQNQLAQQHPYAAAGARNFAASGRGMHSNVPDRKRKLAPNAFASIGKRPANSASSWQQSAPCLLKRSSGTVSAALPAPAHAPPVSSQPAPATRHIQHVQPSIAPGFNAAYSVAAAEVGLAALSCADHVDCNAVLQQMPSTVVKSKSSGSNSMQDQVVPCLDELPEVAASLQAGLSEPVSTTSGNTESTSSSSMQTAWAGGTINPLQQHQQQLFWTQQVYSQHLQESLQAKQEVAASVGRGTATIREVLLSTSPSLGPHTAEGLAAAAVADRGVAAADVAAAVGGDQQHQQQLPAGNPQAAAVPVAAVAAGDGSCILHWGSHGQRSHKQRRRGSSSASHADEHPTAACITAAGDSAATGTWCELSWSSKGCRSRRAKGSKYLSSFVQLLATDGSAAAFAAVGQQDVQDGHSPCIPTEVAATDFDCIPQQSSVAGNSSHHQHHQYLAKHAAARVAVRSVYPQQQPTAIADWVEQQSSALGKKGCVVPKSAHKGHRHWHRRSDSDEEWQPRRRIAAVAVSPAVAEQLPQGWSLHGKRIPRARRLEYGNLLEQSNGDSSNRKQQAAAAARAPADEQLETEQQDINLQQLQCQDLLVKAEQLQSGKETVQLGCCTADVARSPSDTAAPMQLCKQETTSCVDIIQEVKDDGRQQGLPMPQQQQQQHEQQRQHRQPQQELHDRQQEQAELMNNQQQQHQAQLHGNGCDHQQQQLQQRTSVQKRQQEAAQPGDSHQQHTRVQQWQRQEQVQQPLSSREQQQQGLPLCLQQRQQQRAAEQSRLDPCQQQERQPKQDLLLGSRDQQPLQQADQSAAAQISSALPQECSLEILPLEVNKSSIHMQLEQPPQHLVEDRLLQLPPSGPELAGGSSGATQRHQPQYAVEMLPLFKPASTAASPNRQQQQLVPQDLKWTPEKLKALLCPTGARLRCEEAAHRLQADAGAAASAAAEIASADVCHTTTADTSARGGAITITNVLAAAESREDTHLPAVLQPTSVAAAVAVPSAVDHVHQPLAALELLQGKPAAVVEHSAVTRSEALLHWTGDTCVQPAVALEPSCEAATAAEFSAQAAESVPGLNQLPGALRSAAEGLAVTRLTGTFTACTLSLSHAAATAATPPTGIIHSGGRPGKDAPASESNGMAVSKAADAAAAAPAFGVPAPTQLAMWQTWAMASAAASVAQQFGWGNMAAAGISPYSWSPPAARCGWGDGSAAKQPCRFPAPPFGWPGASAAGAVGGSSKDQQRPSPAARVDRQPAAAAPAGAMPHQQPQHQVLAAAAASDSAEQRQQWRPDAAMDAAAERAQDHQQQHHDAAADPTSDVVEQYQQCLDSAAAAAAAANTTGEQSQWLHRMPAAAAECQEEQRAPALAASNLDSTAAAPSDPESVDSPANEGAYAWRWDPSTGNFTAVNPATNTQRLQQLRAQLQALGSQQDQQQGLQIDGQKPVQLHHHQQVLLRPRPWQQLHQKQLAAERGRQLQLASESSFQERRRLQELQRQQRQEEGYECVLVGRNSRQRLQQQQQQQGGRVLQNKARVGDDEFDDWDQFQRQQKQRQHHASRRSRSATPDPGFDLGSGACEGLLPGSTAAATRPSSFAAALSNGRDSYDASGFAILDIPVDTEAAAADISYDVCIDPKQRLPCKDAQSGDYKRREPNNLWDPEAYELAAISGAAMLGVPLAPLAHHMGDCSDPCLVSSLTAAAARAAKRAAAGLPAAALTAECGVLMLAHEKGVSTAAAWEAWEQYHEGKAVVLVHLKQAVAVNAGLPGHEWLAQRLLSSRVNSQWGDTSLTAAMLAATAEMLQRCPNLQHVAVVSGHDVPVAALPLPLPAGVSMFGSFQFGRAFDDAARQAAAAALHQQLGMNAAEARQWGASLTFHHTWMILSRPLLLALLSRRQEILRVGDVLNDRLMQPDAAVAADEFMLITAALRYGYSRVVIRSKLQNYITAVRRQQKQQEMQLDFNEQDEQRRSKLLAAIPCSGYSSDDEEGFASAEELFMAIQAGAAAAALRQQEAAEAGTASDSGGGKAFSRPTRRRIAALLQLQWSSANSGNSSNTTAGAAAAALPPRYPGPPTAVAVVAAPGPMEGPMGQRSGPNGSGRQLTRSIAALLKDKAAADEATRELAGESGDLHHGVLLDCCPTLALFHPTKTRHPHTWRTFSHLFECDLNGVGEEHDGRLDLLQALGLVKPNQAMFFRKLDVQNCRGAGGQAAQEDLLTVLQLMWQGRPLPESVAGLDTC